MPLFLCLIFQMYLINKFTFFLLLGASVLFYHCGPTESIPSFDIDKIEGLIPVYESELIIQTLPPKEIIESGKILVYSDFLLVNDLGSGIHVIDNQDKRSPKKLYFIAIPASNDLAVKNGLLYVDNGPDLVVIQFDRQGATEVSRKKEIFYPLAKSQDYPEQNNVYFQCPDFSRGKVVGWKVDVLTNPQCYKSFEI